MNNYMLTCCSTADMPETFFHKNEVPYVCFHYDMDGEQYPDDLGKTMPIDEFYKKIEQGAMPTTSQVNVGEFMEFFEPFLKEGKDIIHVSLSTGISGSYNSACVAARDLLEQYPERKIKIVDSLGASSGYGLLIDAMVQKREEGLTVEELYQWAEEHKQNVHHWFFTSDLTHLKRGGRISATSAIMGNLLNICPLMNMDFNGKLIPRLKIRGKKRVMNEMVHKMELHAQDGVNYSGKCFISNSACYEDARAVADLVEQKFPKLNGKVQINSIGTVIGSHTGPGTVALFFFGDKRID